MPKKVVAKFQIEYIQVMDENGNVDKKLMPKLTNDQIKYFYETMVLARKIDDKMLAMQRQGRIATFPAIKGQEASTIGSAFALQKKDWLVPAFRENPAFIVRGCPLEKAFLLYGGTETGSVFPQEENDLPVAVPVGTQPLHAVGIAMAMNIQKEKNAVITYFGDGATSEGDVNEAINFAGALQAPVVFFNQNNQWAISLPRESQSAAQTLAQKGLAGGLSCIQVDGNDIFAVYKVTKEALDNARKGKGPQYIESLTYRLGDHTTADDAAKYRDPKEVKLWEKKDPILRLQKFMKAKKLWTVKYGQDVQKKLDKKVEETVKKFESEPQSNPEDMFKYTYKELTPELKEQKESLMNFLQSQKGETNG